MSAETKKSFIGGAMLLMVSNLAGKLIGMFYKIWLAALITDGMSFHNLPYPVYNFLLVISSAGLPTAISRMVSTRLATQDRVGARMVLRAARRILFITGLIASVFMFILAKPLAAAAGDPEAAPAFMMMAPAIFIVCMISAYRGYFQGMQRMAPTAVSQLIEQVGKLVVGFPLAMYGSQFGALWGAVYAIAGMAISELGALMLMLGANARQNVRDKDILHLRESEKGILPLLFKIAVPVTIGSAIMPIVGIADSFLILNRLTDIGYTLQEARDAYSGLTTIVNSFVNMPAVITLSISIALVPAISSALATKDAARARTTASTGLRAAVLIGAPAAVGMALLAEPIVRLVFYSQSPEMEAMRQAGIALLPIASVGILFLSVVQATTGALQGYGKPIIPVYTLGAGIIVKILLNHILIGTPGIEIQGASIATVSCYFVAMLGNVWFLMKISGIRLKFFLSLLRPVASALVMGGALSLWNRYFPGNTEGLRGTLLAVAFGAAVYGIMALITRSITKDDLSMIPGGNRLLRLAGRFKK